MATALAFCGLFALGLLLFAVAPVPGAQGWRQTLGSAALFGLFTCMTYDLTDTATLHVWPLEAGAARHRVGRGGQSRRCER